MKELKKLRPIAKVVTSLSLDRGFDYHIPEHLLGEIKLGSFVEVPLGNRKVNITGYVVEFPKHSDYPNLKDIAGFAGKDHIPASLIKVALWMANYYCCPVEQAVRAMLPAAVRSGKIKEKLQIFIYLNAEKDFELALENNKRAKSRIKILKHLKRFGSTAVTKLYKDLGVTSSPVATLKKDGWIFSEKWAVQRDPYQEDVIIPSNPQRLTKEQAVVMEKICHNLQQQKSHTMVLHGVTGSGKTEVYMQAIQYCLEQGRQAIVLVPEIALTPQTNEHFRARFGDQVSMMHSGLSDGERFDEWRKMNAGKAQIVVGARSALFSPFRNIGLIVVDEEHENSYKQDKAPRYNARDVAVLRGKYEDAVVLLGSATPSFESYQNCLTGKYQLTEMLHRVDNQQMPSMALIDMRQESASKGRATIFSRTLIEMIQSKLAVHEQVILFLNRRGFATQMLCSMCGFVATCDDCSLTYTYHRQKEMLICHLCGKRIAAPKYCPKCSDKNIRYTGLGTEKVEDIARKLFPSANIERMDSDTMTAKDSYSKVLGRFRAAKIDILIGTQMIAKGLHFPNVTLVGVVFADLGLHIPDFRAGERVFQLLVQVAGRAGRGRRAGKVIVQTYTPFHPALQHALKYDYKNFYEEEVECREMLNFPPKSHFIVVHFRGINEMRVAHGAKEFCDELKRHLPEEAILNGPIPSPISRIKKHFRYQLTVRGGETRQILHIIRHLSLQWWPKNHQVEVYADVDAYSLM